MSAKPKRMSDAALDDAISQAEKMWQHWRTLADTEERLWRSLLVERAVRNLTQAKVVMVASVKKPIWTPHKSKQRLVTHSANLCAGEPCPVHNPSAHHMRDWPQHYRTDRGIIERICQHGVGHPDPDCAESKRQGGVHGCDGCCQPPKPKAKRKAFNAGRVA